MDIFVLKRPEAPWGDYGSILMHGMTSHLPRQEGLLQLERTGSFVPPISFPGAWDIVVTDEFKQLLDRSGLSGFTFQPVIKRHIVRLDWEQWDKARDEPDEYPETGEPEDYILARPHSPELAEQLGDLWEIALDEHADIERVHVGPGPFDEEIYLIESTWDGTDIFWARGIRRQYVSERAKAWLERAAGQWVAFEPALTK